MNEITDKQKLELLNALIDRLASDREYTRYQFIEDSREVIDCDEK